MSNYIAGEAPDLNHVKGCVPIRQIYRATTALR